MPCSEIQRLFFKSALELENRTHTIPFLRFVLIEKDLFFVSLNASGGLAEKYLHEIIFRNSCVMYLVIPRKFHSA